MDRIGILLAIQVLISSETVVKVYWCGRFFFFLYKMGSRSCFRAVVLTRQPFERAFLFFTRAFCKHCFVLTKDNHVLVKSH